MNRLDNTLGSLSYLIENLYRTHCLYTGLLNSYPALSGVIEPLNKRMVEFLLKLLKEYKRLSKNEYKLEPCDRVVGDKSAENMFDECLKSEENLISLYSEILDEDVLWEVVPVLAHHLAYFKTYKENLSDFNQKQPVASLA